MAYHLIHLLPTPIAVVVSSSSSSPCNAAKSSSENDNLEAAQETAQQLALLQHNSKEEDNTTELHEENNDETTKLLEYHAKNYLNLQWVGRMFRFYLLWQLDAIPESFPAIKILPFPSPKFITQKKA